VWLRNSGAVIAVEAQEGKGKDFSISLICTRTPDSPLPQVARCSVQPVAISTQSMV